MGNEQDQEQIFDSTLGERIAEMIETEVTRNLEGLNIEEQVAKSLEGLDIGMLVHVEIEKALTKIEQKLAHVRDRAQRAQEKAHRAAEKMARHQEKMRRAAEKMARRQERVQQVAQKQYAGTTMNVKTPTMDTQQVSEEEQLSILRMLQEGTITPEQADTLLSALAA